MTRQTALQWADVSVASAGLAVLALGLALAPAPPLAAQQPETEGGIVTEELEPLTPSGETAPRGDLAPQDSRFKPAPFSTPELPRTPELIEPVETALKPGARLRQLDKMTGQTETFDVAAGAEAEVDRLRVKLEACRAPEDNAQQGTQAFLQVWDRKQPDGDPVFSGWMFAESPALSAMDHPRYDLWVINCTTSSGGESSASE